MMEVRGPMPLCWLMPLVFAVLAGCAHISQVRDPTTPSTSPAPLPPPPPSPSPPPVPIAGKVRFAAEALFDSEGSDLKPDVRAKLDDFLSEIKVSDLGTGVILAVGHSDAIGSDAFNQQLSVRRAEAVKDYLVSKGVDSNRVYTEGKGATQPVADKGTLEGRAKNNRVELEFVSTRSVTTKSVDRDPPTHAVPVLFATNRQRTGSDNPYHFYGNRLIDEPDSRNLRRGIALIKIPPKRERGEVSRADLFRITLERLTSHPLPRAAGIEPIQAANAQTEFSYAQRIEELTYAAFAEALKMAVKQSKSKTAVLYVHGYSNDFTDAAFRTSQIVYDLATPEYDLVPLMFSWPSDPGLIGMNYSEARRRSQASGYDLAQFLKEISSNTNIGTIHIIAHSMGAEVLGHAMMKLGVSEMGNVRGDKSIRPVFRQIVFAAPDVTPRIFQDVIEPAIHTNHAITTYGATTDLPLWVSAIKNQQSRAGAVSGSERLAECVDTVDVTAVTKKGLSHSTWAESPRVLDDIRLLLRDGLDPLTRGLTQRRLMASTIWMLPATAPVGNLQTARRTPKVRTCRPH